MKIKVELDLKTIQALSDLKVEGMKEHVENYNTCTHRWRNNMDRIGMVLRYITSDYPTYPTEEDSKKSLMSYLSLIVTDIEPLLSKLQEQYIWDTLPPSQLDLIRDIRSMCQWAQGEHFDVTYYIQYIKKCNEFFEELIMKFNASH